MTTSLSTVYTLGIIMATFGGIAAAFLTLKFNPIPDGIEAMKETATEQSLVQSAVSAVNPVQPDMSIPPVLPSSESVEENPQ